MYFLSLILVSLLPKLMGHVYMMEHHCGCSSSSGGVIPLFFFLSFFITRYRRNACNGWKDGRKKRYVIGATDYLIVAAV